MSKGQDKFICIQSKQQQTWIEPEIHEQLNKTVTCVSVTTVQCQLPDSGVKGCEAARQPLLRKQNMVK